MKYRTLGKTGLRVSEVGYGCGNVGGLMIRGTEEEQIEAVRHAIGLGINYYDTAVLYGNGQSETNLGKVLKRLKPDVHVATKFSINEEDAGDIRGAVMASSLLGRGARATSGLASGPRQRRRRALRMPALLRLPSISPQSLHRVPMCLLSAGLMSRRFQ